MTPRPPEADDFLTISDRIRVAPVVHGSGDCALLVREELLARSYDCLAVPLPPSFQDEVEAAVDALPTISVVVRRDLEEFDPDRNPEDDVQAGFSYVPIDPCQPVVAAIRTALGERIPRAFIDLETARFEARTAAYPDPYALKSVRPEAFAAAILPSVPPPAPGQQADRIAWMADQLRRLESNHRRILLVCSLVDWPWIRDAYQRQLPVPDPDPIETPVDRYGVDPQTLVFLLGELPYLTGLYERGRIELTDDDNLSIDGVKEMLVAARERLRRTLPRVARRITPHLLSVLLRYVRNLTLMNRRISPDLYGLVVAARQTAGDDYALALAETAREYPYMGARSDVDDWRDGPPLRMGLGQAEVPGWGVASMANRLPGQSIAWRNVELRPRPPEREKKLWKQRWDPYGMCSWPPEDDRIESFHRHVRDQAKALLGADLARSEKFTTSVMDGLDIRETLRQWHTGDLYVKVVPPARGTIEAVVFLFDVPADPDRYVHRATWYAEHADESTLAFFATDPTQDFVGPGVARAEYGGAFFLFPPRPLPDVWRDPRLNFARTLEERLIAGACLHSQERFVAIVSPNPPTASWRRLARRYGRKLVHLPLKRFGTQLIERLRTFHVLNGKQVRSYAADYIRDG